MNVVVVGGGINGLFTAWRLSCCGFKVKIYEAERLLSQTSSASSKLLHGGIRYLEQGHISLVREALLDRKWWLDNCPTYAQPIEINMPVFLGNPRSQCLLYAGAMLYTVMAGKASLGRMRRFNRDETLERSPELDPVDLRGSVSFFDAQMNEEKLGLWVKSEAHLSGVQIFENTLVSRVTTDGKISTDKFGDESFDYIINVCGPWASQIIKTNGIESDFDLKLVRGSHLFVDKKISRSYLVQEPSGRRVVFILPYDGKTLVGTTEVEQGIDEPIECSVTERDYLLRVYNSYFREKITSRNIISEFSGLRPIIRPNRRGVNLSAASREARIEKIDRLVNVFGGKWTSAPSLSKKVCAHF